MLSLETDKKTAENIENITEQEGEDDEIQVKNAMVSFPNPFDGDLFEEVAL